MMITGQTTPTTVFLAVVVFCVLSQFAGLATAGPWGRGWNWGRKYSSRNRTQPRPSPPLVRSARISLDQFMSSFAQPYQNAIQTLADRTLKPLADAAIPSQIEDADQLINNTKANFQSFYNLLEPMRAASAQFRDQQAQEIAKKTLQLGQSEEALRQTESQISSSTVELNQNTAALTSAQAQLNQENVNLESARRTLSEQEHRLDRAKNCIWKGKRSVRERRFIKKWFKKVKNAVKKVVNAPCDIFINVNGARAAVRSAERNVAASQQRVANAQASVQAVQNRIAQLQQTKAQQEATKQNLVNQIAEMRNKLSLLSQINVKISQVVLYLASLFDVGQSIKNIMKKMVDIAALLDPLQQIATLVGSFGGYNTTQLQASLDSIRQSMVTLNVKLPQYPLDERVPV